MLLVNTREPLRTLKKLLYDRCFTQRDIARKAGVSKSMVCSVLSGERNPGPRTRRKIAAALEIPPAELFRFPRGDK
jgi:transcriptional regulator with XRE-family HTH domain